MRSTPRRVRNVGELAVVVLALGVIGACARARVTRQAPIEDAFACWGRRMKEMGYVITSANKEAGVITADKRVSPGVVTASRGEYYDQLTVEIDASSRVRRTVSWVTSRIQKGAGTTSQSGMASDQTKADAKTILSDCEDALRPRN